MSKYTTEIRFICETEAGLTESSGFNSIDDILNKSCSKIFNFDFPIFDEDYRLTLEKNILRHYYTREIAHETVGLWKLKLCDKLNMIMPYYNQLYKSELLEFNPLYDVDFERKGNNKGNTKSNSKGNSKQESNTIDRNLYSDTPQGALKGVNDEEYLTNARKIITDDNVEHNNNLDFNEDRNDDYFEKVIGKTSGTSYSKMLLEFRKTFLNIDKMIIEELQDLFFGLW